jgi:galactose-1-phosphate uridylyltransferase
VVCSKELKYIVGLHQRKLTQANEIDTFVMHIFCKLWLSNSTLCHANYKTNAEKQDKLKGLNVSPLTSSLSFPAFKHLGFTF